MDNILSFMGSIAMYFANNSLNTLSHWGFYQPEMEEETQSNPNELNQLKTSS
ncbi:MAG: cyclic lactone autoinducer peptide [Anaerorhabdus sp.]|jgi:cyclic lactone autoinducer peptide